MFEDKRQPITIEEFREKFCKECFWKKHSECDIARVEIKYCAHSQVRTWEIKLI